MSDYADINKLTENFAQTRTYSDADIENILFPRMTLNENFLATTTKADFQHKLKHASLKRSRYALHGTTLSEYVRIKRIPRGLRIQKRPTLGRHDPEFCQQWCEILNKASLDLTVLVIQHTQKQLASIDAEINEHTTKLESMMSSEDLTQLKEEMKAAIDRYEQDLTKTKLSKFRRDTLDYKNDNVYPWLKWIGDTRRRTRTGGAYTSESSASEFQSDSDGDFLDNPHSYWERARQGQHNTDPARPTGGARGRGRGRDHQTSAHLPPTRQSNRSKKKVTYY